VRVRGGVRTTVKARRASRRQLFRLWPMLKSANPFYAHCERMMARHLPVVLLERCDVVDATAGIGNKAPPEDTP
jgi:hypothetical protein